MSSVYLLHHQCCFSKRPNRDLAKMARILNKDNFDSPIGNCLLRIMANSNLKTWIPCGPSSPPYSSVPNTSVTLLFFFITSQIKKNHPTFPFKNLPTYTIIRNYTCVYSHLFGGAVYNRNLQSRIVLTVQTVI